jgi:hypothetical protein
LLKSKPVFRKRHIHAAGGHLLTSPKAIERDAYKPRAQRFPIETRFRYRIGGEPAWREGTTINISRSGILFRAQKEIVPRAMLQMRIVFPSELTGYDPVSIVCWGPVIRSESDGASGSDRMLAAAIIRYRFIQEDSSDLPVNYEI